MIKKTFFVLLIILIGLPTVLLPSNRDIRFRHISLEEGLSQSLVFCILQDSKGFMWFGTQDGLNKYDGYGFKIYRSDPENPKSLSHSIIADIVEDRSGALWAGTSFGGLNKFNRETEEFTIFRNNPDDPTSLSNNNVTIVYEDRSGVLWAGTVNGLNKFHPETGTFTRYRNIPGDAASLANNQINVIYQDNRGTLWVGTNFGLHKMNPETGKFVRFQRQPGKPGSLSHNVINDIYEDHSGEFWIGTVNGLNRFDRETGRCTVYLFRPDEPHSLSNSNVSRIYEDHGGVLWIGTAGGGLNTFDRRGEHFVHYRRDPDNPDSLSSDLISSIFEDRSGTLWIGTAGGGINRFDRGAEKFKRYTTIPNNPNSLSHGFVYSFAEDRSGTIWLATFGGGLNKFDHKSEQFTHYRAAAGNANRSNGTGGSNRLSSDFIFSVTVDGDGIIWMGTNGAGLDRFDPETGKVTNYPAFPRRPSGLNSGFIRSLHLDPSGVLWAGTIGGGLNKFDRETGTVTAYYLPEADNPHSLGGVQTQDLFEDKDGFLWIGTADAGLNKFDRETGRFTRYLNRPNDPTSLSSNIIMCIYQEPSGIFWIGTFGGGLNKFDAQKGIFTQYREKHGLPNDTVYGVLRDDDGFLWVSTNKGLSKFDPRVGSFRNYTPHDGLQGNEFNGAAFYESRAGKMFFGGIDGFNVFSPRDIKDNKNIPPIVITGFQIFNQPVGIGGDSPLEKDITETKEIVLPYKINVFSFNFVALDYTIPEKNQYKYMMEGFDRDWLSTDASKRFATYTNLDPGDYVFRVKGSNNDGVWNEEGTAIKIVITPPFWKTWWFRVLVGLLAAVSALLFHRVMKRNIARTTRMQTELQTARTAQMSIMPQSDPQIEGFNISGICVPAYEVGGDFFDYFWLNPEKTRFGIAIGDVSGKAMKAAMTAVMSSGMIYSRIYSVTSVKETMTQVNHPLFLKTDKKMFTALCLASLDINTKEFVFTNAGLSEPLLKSQGKAVYIESIGPRLPLGSFRDNTYQETSLQLKTSDVVVLFTDGIPDSRNENGEFYGYGTLKKLVEKMDTASLSAAEIKEAIIGDVKRFSGAVPQQDDMTVVVIKFQL